MPKISALPAMTAIAADDELPIVDTSAGSTKKVTNGLLTGNPDFGWTAAAETWAYSAWDSTRRIATITVPSDATLKYTPGNRIRITQSTGGTKYGILHGVTATTLYVLFQVGITFNNESISAPMFSPLDTPYGFNKGAELWDFEFTESANAQQASPTTNTWYNVGSALLALGYGKYEICYELMEAANGSSTITSAFATLSTANNSETDIGMSFRAYGSADALQLTPATRKKNISITSNTTYYLNQKTDVSSTYIGGFTTQGYLKLKARSLYL